jgi:glycolate oxidase FAD binding subunit
VTVDLSRDVTVAPGDVAELREHVADAFARRTPLRIVGRGTWAGAGRPVRASSTVSVAGLTGIVEYTPGDLTLTARAGTTLGEISAVTAADGQFLALEPWGDGHGSLGATIATASAGPSAATLGLPRDIALGVEFVTGTGDLVRGGGRVVKNVAGFDLTRLSVGAWGSLGILTEITVRLRARPAADETVTVTLPPDDTDREALLARWRTDAIAPIALEAVNAPLSARLGLGGAPCVLVRLAGNEQSVRTQRGVLANSAECASTPADIWRRLLACEPAHAAVLRVSAAPTRAGAVFSVACDVAHATGGFASASLARGIARCALPTVVPEAIRDAVSRIPQSMSTVFEQLPASLWSELAGNVAGDRLSRGIKRAFDPEGILNPGIFGDQ